MKYPFDSLRFWLGLFLFSVYLLTFSGKFHVMDELAVFTAANNLAQHGRADINQLIWTNHWTPNPPGIWGQDGNLYTKKAPGISFITAPLIWLGHTLPGLNAVHVGLLTNALVTALTASLLFLWLADLGFSRPTALLTTLGYGLCTIAWIYARMFWESSLLALTFLVGVWAIYRATRLAYARQRLRWIFLSGAAMAVGLTLRFEAVPATIFIGLYIIWESISWPVSQFVRRLRGDTEVYASEHELTASPILLPQTGQGLIWALPWGRLIIFLTPTLLIGLGLLYFNLIRYGTLSETGYSQELLFRAPWVGSFGLLLSPGRGLFIYAPFTLLLFFGLKPAWRRLSTPYFWLIAALCLFYWLFYGAWFAWGGTWGWGPRFLLPILPLLMQYAAEPIEWVYRQGGRLFYAPRLFSRVSLAWFGIGLLILLSLMVNLLGIVVDFNEHFLRLGRNDNFVFNWQAFPPLAHWRILQEGLVDLIWLRPQAGGLVIEWSILIPGLLLFALATTGLTLTFRYELSALKHKAHPPHLKARPFAAYPLAATYYWPRTTLYILLFLLLPLTLTYHLMTNTARLGLENEQAQADRLLLETLTSAAKEDDALLIPMPPFGDVQEVSTMLIAYLDTPLPTSAWIESEPRAIHATERTKISKATQAEADRVWLFERWLTQDAPTTPTASYFNQAAFPLHEQWFEQSGKLTLYSLAPNESLPSPTEVNVPFQGGISLLDFSLADAHPSSEEQVLKLRLTWQATDVERLSPDNIFLEGIVVFAQLLDEVAGHNIAQSDRLLLHLQNIEQSPLLPGQTVQQGYGLALPDDLTPGAYPLIVGLYHAPSGQRLTRMDDNPDDFLYLTTVVVE